MGGPRSGLFQLVVRRSGAAVERVPLLAFPFVVGRGSQCSFVLQAPGVWDRHLRFELDPTEGLVVHTEPGAIVLHDGRSFEQRRLHNGDELMAGSAAIQVHLAPPLRRSLRFWEFILWLVFGAVVVVQIVAAVRLLAD